MTLDDPWGDSVTYSGDKWLMERFAPDGPITSDYGLPRYGLANIWLGDADKWKCEIGWADWFCGFIDATLD